MKKQTILAAILVLLISASLTACGGKSNQNSAADTYIELAQGFVDKGDYDAAIETLQKGFDLTGDEKIAAMLKETISNQVNDIVSGEEPQNSAPDKVPQDDKDIDTKKDVDINDYIGTWATENTDWINGGLILDIYQEQDEYSEDEYVTFLFSYYQSAPSCCVSTLINSFLPDEIGGNVLSFDYAGDDWGNSGTMTIKLENGKISCELSNVQMDMSARWGFGYYDYNFELFPDASAHNAMEVDDEEFYERFPEDNSDYQNYSDYVYTDPSKASGILASLGFVSAGRR